MMDSDLNSNGGFGGDQYTGSSNWWEGPPPAGYSGQWPPPLPPGGSYGPNFGQVINPAGGTADTHLPSTFQPGVNLPYGTPAATTSGGGDTGGGGGNGGGGNGLPSPFTSPFTPPAPVNLGGPAGIPYIPPTPQFNAPGYKQAPAFQAPSPFQAPSMQDVLNDPGYQFPLSQGLGAMSNSKAAQGLWGTGATGKAFNDYAQNYANQFYGNIYNRDLNTYQTNYANSLNAYNTNYGTQYKDPNTYDYTAALASFAPQMTGYETQAAAGQHQNDLNYSNAYQQWLDNYNQKLGTAKFLFDTTQA